MAASCVEWLMAAGGCLGRLAGREGGTAAHKPFSLLPGGGKGATP